MVSKVSLPSDTSNLMMKPVLLMEDGIGVPGARVVKEMEVELFEEQGTPCLSIYHIISVSS